MPTSATDLAIGLAITLVFLAPALAWPTLGRALLSVFFIGGATFNLLYTLPNLPASLEALVATSTIPLYREVVELAAAWHVGAALIALVIAFEATAGALTLWRGPLVRVALLLAAAWGLAMLPVIPPYGLPIGVALTGAPALAALVLFRKRYPESVPSGDGPAPGHGSSDPPTRPRECSAYTEEHVKLHIYVLGAAIVWVGILFATALVLQDTP
jgi:hypothetical protein